MVPLLLLGPGFSAGQPTVITGDYLEDRANKVYGCYCEWSGEGEHGGREAVLAWRVRSGAYEGVDLAGLKMAVVIQGERALIRRDTARQSILIVDSAAPESQRKAAERLLRASYGELMGRVVAVHRAPVEISRDSARASLRVSGLLNVEMRKARLPQDALPGAILWYDPFTPMPQSTLGTTLNDKFAGTDFDHRWNKSEPGVSGYYGSFVLKLP